VLLVFASSDKRRRAMKAFTHYWKPLAAPAASEFFALPIDEKRYRKQLSIMGR
jgi:hypothetical protein